MNRRAIFVTAAALALCGGALAESPIVLRIRDLVRAIDAGIGSRKGEETSINLEGPDGVNKLVADQRAEAVSIRHWSPARSGGKVKAVASFGGEFEGTEAQYYWRVSGNLVQTPLFAYMKKTFRDNNNKTTRTEERRCYFENGKPKIFRIGSRTESVTDRRCKAVVKSMGDVLTAITPGD